MRNILITSISILIVGCGSNVQDTGPIDQPGFANMNPVITILPPRSDNPSVVEYCKLDGDELRVEFQNIGNMATGGSVDVTVSFKTSNGPANFVRTRGPLEISEVAVLRYPIPNRCFNQDCDFAIQWSNQPAVDGRRIG